MCFDFYYHTLNVINYLLSFVMVKNLTGTILLLVDINMCVP